MNVRNDRSNSAEKKPFPTWLTRLVYQPAGSDLPGEFARFLAGVASEVGGRIAGIVEEGRAQGQFPPHLDGEAIAATIVATVQGGYVLARASGSPTAFDAGVRGLLSLLSPQ